MASSCAHLGRHIHKSGQILQRGVRDIVQRRYVGLGSAACQQSASEVSGSAEEIVIPRKKIWNKEAVLQALASTVKRDPTGSPYQFQDDIFLTPRTYEEFKRFSVTKESGRRAAKYFLNTYPKYFQKDFAEPHIPCFMPETVELQIKEVSEAALIERIQLRKVKAAVQVYDQLQQAGTTLSLDLTNDLLDLICFYGDRDPAPGPAAPEMIADDMEEDQEDEQEDEKRKTGIAKMASNSPRTAWRNNNNAERIFNMMPERTRRSYGALIRGMVKHGAYSKAFDMYTDLLNNRLKADVHIFNALLTAATKGKKNSANLDLIFDLLEQMAEQKVEPNLLTFNAVLKGLQHLSPQGRTKVFPLISEMNALGIAPSLATYNHILNIFYKSDTATENQSKILSEVLNKIAGKSFTPQDPDDVLFFENAMRICLKTKDKHQGYRVHHLLEVGENWKLLGDSFLFYGRFLNLLFIMEHVTEALNWYKKIVPSRYIPKAPGMSALLQALQADNRLDLIPEIWKDIQRFVPENNTKLLEKMLSLMSCEEQSPEVLQAFADCALDVKAQYMQSNLSQQLRWSTSSLTSITSVLLAAERTEQAWEMLNLFKLNNKVPSARLLEKFLASIKASNNAEQAVKLVQYSASFCLPITTDLMKRVEQDFELSEEQRNVLSDHLLRI